MNFEKEKSQKEITEKGKKPKLPLNKWKCVFFPTNIAYLPKFQELSFIDEGKIALLVRNQVIFK